jgi:hypothetical protein
MYIGFRVIECAAVMIVACMGFNAVLHLAHPLQTWPRPTLLVQSKGADTRSSIRGLKAREAEYIPLVTRTPMARRAIGRVMGTQVHILQS